MVALVTNIYGLYTPSVVIIEYMLDYNVTLEKAGRSLLERTNVPISFGAFDKTQQLSSP